LGKLLLSLHQTKNYMYLGFNGENWFQAQDENAKTWLGEMIEEGETFCLRLRQDKPDSDPSDIEKLVELRDT
jgi:hypothetical protein